MKRYLLILTFVLFSVNGVFAVQFEDLVQKGNNFYQNEQYEEAISVYKKVVENGYESPVLYYNIGNSYFKQGKLGYSILYYEKALKLNPSDEDAEYNLRLANARIVDRIKELPEVPILAYFDIVVTSFTLSGWLTIFVVFWLLLLGCVAVYFLIGRVRIQRLATMFGLFNITMLVIVGIFLASSLHREQTTNYAILLKMTATAKTSPDASQNDAFVIHEGIKFQVEEQLSDWSRIKLPDGKVGWLQNDTFEAI